MINLPYVETAIDSTPPLGGPNEALNPIDLLLGALATCGAFLFETTARNEGITLDDVSVTVEGDFDARGIKDPDINPRIQQYRAVVRSSGPTNAEKQQWSPVVRLDDIEHGCHSNVANNQRNSPVSNIAKTLVRGYDAQ